MTTLISRLTLAFLILATTIPAAAQMGPPDFTVTPQERTAVIDGAIAKLNQTYVFPDVAKKMGDAVRSRAAKGEYNSITSARALAEKLTEDFRAVNNDRHLSVMYFAGGAPPDETDDAAPTPDQLSFIKRVNAGFEKVERMMGNIGYVEIRGFVPPSLGGETASAAMTMIANTDALIVDLRRNGGGEPAMIAYVQSYLFDQPTHLNDIWERVGDRTQQWWTMPHVPGLRFGGTKPVFVLTSKETFSGGEEFAYNIKTQKRGIVVGETTGGGAHPVRGLKISEHFAIGVPFARAINPITKTNWEGTGVTPDVAKPASEALDAAYLMALEKVVATTTDPRQKEQLQRLIAEKKKT